MKKIWLFALSMFTFSCSANQNLEPKSVTLIYEKSMLTAEIQTDNNFKAHINNEKESIDFSGSVKNIHSNYQIKVLVVATDKIRHSMNQISTSVSIGKKQLEKPILIAGIYTKTELSHDKNNKAVTYFGTGSSVSVKLNQ